MPREALSTVVRRRACRSSLSERDVGTVRPIGGVRSFGFRLHRSAWLTIYGGVGGYRGFLVTALWESGCSACT